MDTLHTIITKTWFKMNVLLLNGGNEGTNFSNPEKISGRMIPADLVS